MMRYLDEVVSASQHKLPEPAKETLNQLRQLTKAIYDRFILPGHLGDLTNSGKLGLAGMEERARLLGGTLNIQSEPGRGTTVTVDLPLEE
jgi:signal transduction histidine kinase